MVLLFPQWQGANRRAPILRGVKSLETYYGDQITHRIITERHTMITSKAIHNYSAIYNQTLRCRELLKREQPKRIFTIGGDCGVELMPVSYLNQKYDHLGIIWFDAHADANTPETSVSKNFHGMPLRQLCGDGDNELNKLIFTKVKPEQILYAGLRDVDIPEAEWIQKHNIFTSKETEISRMLTTLKDRKIQNLYIHFDVDVLSPKEYEHMLLPTENGIDINHAIKTIRSLNDHFNIVGTSVTEVTADDQEALKMIHPILDLLLSVLED